MNATNAQKLRGQMVAGYRLTRLLGRGRMGVVFMGQKPGDGDAAPVAVKLLRRARLNVATTADFEATLATVQQFDHRSIAPVLDYGDAGQWLYVVRPYFPMGSLEQRLQESGSQRAPLVPALRLAIDIGEALRYAHSRGVVHGSVNPRNVLLGPREGSGSLAVQPCLTDFGVYKLRHETERTLSQQALDVMAYWAPEQWLGHETDERVDVYAVAAILFRLLTGRPPHLTHADEAPAVDEREVEAPDPGELRPSLPAIVDRILERGLAVAAGARYQTMEAFVLALQEQAVSLEHAAARQEAESGETPHWLSGPPAAAAPSPGASPPREAPTRMEPAPASRTAARLKVVPAAGEAIFFRMGLPLISLGSDDDNDIVLPAVDVADHHLELEQRADGWFVTPLSRNTPTRLDGQVLPRGRPHHWPPGQALLIGPYHLEWEVAPPEPIVTPPLEATEAPVEQTAAPTVLEEPPGAAAAPEPSAGPPPAAARAGAIAVNLEPASIAALPGKQYALQVELRNDSARGDTIHLEVEGNAAGWFTVPEGPFFAGAGSAITVPLTVALPAGGRLPAGSHPFYLLARSDRDPQDMGVIEGQVAVQAVADLVVELTPEHIRHGRPAQLTLANHGTVPTQATLALDADEEEIRVGDLPETVSLAPGAEETREINLAAAHRPLIGRRQRYPFTLRVWSDDGRQQAIEGDVRVGPRIPWWILLLLLVLLFVGGTALAFANLVPVEGADNPLAGVLPAAAKETATPTATPAGAEADLPAAGVVSEPPAGAAVSPPDTFTATPAPAATVTATLTPSATASPTPSTTPSPTATPTFSVVPEAGAGGVGGELFEVVPTLVATLGTPAAAPEPQTYTVVLRTGCVEDAGTDADVFLTLYGAGGRSAEQELSGAGDDFDRCRVRTYEIENPVDLGPLLLVHARHDNTGENPSWLLHSVSVADLDGDAVWHFTCGRWLAEGEEDGRIARNLYITGTCE